MTKIVHRMAAAYRGDESQGARGKGPVVVAGNSVFVFMKDVSPEQQAQLDHFMTDNKLDGKVHRFSDGTGTTVNIYVGHPAAKFEAAIAKASPEIKQIMEADTLYVSKKGNAFRLSSEDPAIVDKAEAFLKDFLKKDKQGFAVGTHRVDNHIDIKNPSDDLRKLLLQTVRERG